MKRYHIISCHVLWREFCSLAAEAPHVYGLSFLKQGLHNTPDLLRSELQAAIDAVEDDWDAILVGYGLCSRGIEGIQARKKPLVFVRAHDCITFLLGSKERYRQYFDAHPGTYWYSPGWIDTNTQPSKERYELVKQHYETVYGQENAAYLMSMSESWMSNYSNAAYVDLDAGQRAMYQKYTRECAEWLRWDCDLLDGDRRLIADLLAGNWDHERFLVVHPGQRVAVAYGDEIICAASAGKVESTDGIQQ